MGWQPLRNYVPSPTPKRKGNRSQRIMTCQKQHYQSVGVGPCLETRLPGSVHDINLPYLKLTTTWNQLPLQANKLPLLKIHNVQRGGDPVLHRFGIAAVVGDKDRQCCHKLPDYSLVFPQDH